MARRGGRDARQGQPVGLALYQMLHGWVRKTGTLGPSNGIMGEEGGFERLQRSAGNTPLLLLLLPRRSFSSSLVPLVDSLQLSPYRCPRGASGCLYMVRCIQSTSNPLGLVQGTALILSKAASTNLSNPPRIALCLSPSHSTGFFEREQNNTLYQSPPRHPAT